MDQHSSNDFQPTVSRVLQSRSETKAFYDKISKVYDLLAEHSEEPVRRAGLEKLDAKVGESILEIGFGTGHCLVELARTVGPSGKVYGIDLSEGMLKHADELLRREQLRPQVELRCGDAVKLLYDSETMDAVFMSFTLELFDTPEISSVLGECKRVLRPGGRIVVVGMSKEGKEGLLVQAFEWTHQHFPNFLDCRPIFVRRALEEQDFAIVDVSSMHMWVPVEIVLAVKRSSVTAPAPTNNP